MLTRPTGLLTMALALMMIQVLLAGGWLLLLPPQVYMLASKDVPLWRCYPKGHFESHLLLSLVYVILLITATATIALLCCSGSKLDLDDDNQLCYEARWILLASILVAAVFTFWGIVTVAMITPSHSDLASAVAHLLSAKILLLCLYVPKVCLYNRLRSGKSSPQTTLQHFYEISHFRSQPLKTLPSFIPQPPLINMDLPRVTSDDSESLEDPTQIVPSSLYSLDMFSQSSGSQNNIDDDDEGDGDHCEAGTNEFTAPQNTVILVDSKDIARHAAVRGVPGRSLDGSRYRHGCPETETLAHVQGQRNRGLLLRNARHHHVRSLVGTALRKKSWIVEEEVFCLATNGSSRHIDIIAYSQTTKKGYIIDPTIRIETGSSQPEDVNQEKINIYLPTVDYFKAKYSLKTLR
ncbi:hypothetical protein ANN_18025 [Periplaneta americana]|uniref:G-protein coupled receptors family 3 profile domain-containing protein n=1 Tax=Periplaneta americana TaxID=6978 RepID=A0ABQ8SNU7_PERAM|nr:hypothetical protein ANN_18025 [Periplaneta americana]